VCECKYASEYIMFQWMCIHGVVGCEDHTLTYQTHTYTHTHTHIHMRTITAHTHTYMHTYTHTYIHNMHTYIQYICMHTYTCIQDTRSKLSFVAKLIEFVNIASGKEDIANAKKIVTGKEPERTNLLLQELALAGISIHTYIHTYTHTYIYTYIHTCTYIHTYIHTYLQYNTYNTHAIWLWFDMYIQWRTCKNLALLMHCNSTYVYVCVCVCKQHLVWMKKKYSGKWLNDMHNERRREQ